MRLHDAVQKTPGLRLVADNFYGVEQAVIVPKGDAARLAIIEKFIDEARAAGLIADAIARADLVGVDVAPPGARSPEMKAGPHRSTIPQSCFHDTRGRHCAPRMRLHGASAAAPGKLTMCNVWNWDQALVVGPCANSPRRLRKSTSNWIQ